MASNYDLANVALGGQLADQLRDWRAEGLTLDRIAEVLRDDHGIHVSRETVRRWFVDLAVTEGAA